MAAKKGSRVRRRRKWLRPIVNVGVTLGTLANDTLVGANNGDTATESMFVTSVELSYTLIGATAGEGPLLIGIAHSDYSDAEVEEVIEATGSWEVGDLVAQEVAKRKVRIIGDFSSTNADETLNDGKKIKTKLNWRLDTGATIKLWCFNQSGGALSGGASIHADGFAHAFML